MDLQSKNILKNDAFISEFRYSMCWITADQLQEFVAWHRMPINDLRLLQELTKNYFEQEAQVDPGSSVQRVYEIFRQFLNELELNGESSERLTLWYATLYPTDPSNDEIVEKGSPSHNAVLWSSRLQKWARQNLLELRFGMHDIKKSIATSYLRDVHAPLDAVWRKSWSLEQSWRSSETTRSTWDNYLFEKFYRTYRTSPSNSFYSEYRRLMHREWWRQVRDKVSDSQQIGLIAEAHDEPSTSSPGPWHQIEMSLEDAFQVDKYPVFDDVAKIS